LADGWGRWPPGAAAGLGARAQGATGQECWGRCRPGVARPARGVGGVHAFSMCGCFEMRQRREGKRSAGGFEAQVYSWALPRIFVGY
jgi:hypothetical protein